MRLGSGYFLKGDCLDLLKEVPDNSVDMVLCDLPYETVNWNRTHAWDRIIPMDSLWEAYWRVLSPSGAILLFGNEPFSTRLKISQLEHYKYDYIWKKTKVGGFVLAKVKPLKVYETISVFSRGTTSPGRKNNMTYNPQGLVRVDKTVKNSGKNRLGFSGVSRTKPEYVQEFTNYPTDFLEFASEKNTFHPTQKPISLCEHLILTHSNEGAMVLDNCAGSGTTAIAAENTKRRWICMEKDEGYYGKAVERVGKHLEP